MDLAAFHIGNVTKKMKTLLNLPYIEQVRGIGKVAAEFGNYLTHQSGRILREGITDNSFWMIVCFAFAELEINLNLCSVVQRMLTNQIGNVCFSTNQE